MVTQSRSQPVPLLLTRPAEQGRNFSLCLTQRFGDRICLIDTPLLAPRFFDIVLPEGPFAALVLTSQTGVDAFARLGGAMSALPKDVYCVGHQTARHALAVGLRPVIVEPDSAALIARIKLQRPLGKLLHLRGQDARGEVAKNLNIAGIDTVETATYAQLAQTLTPAAEAALVGQMPVVVPLFSPRTALIFATEMARIKGISPLWIAAISGAVALEVATLGAQVSQATSPDAPAMAAVIATILDDVNRA